MPNKVKCPTSTLSWRERKLPERSVQRKDCHNIPKGALFERLHTVFKGERATQNSGNFTRLREFSDQVDHVDNAELRTLSSQDPVCVVLKYHELAVSRPLCVGVSCADDTPEYRQQPVLVRQLAPSSLAWAQ